MKSRLLGTTALLGAALVVGAFPFDAAAQQSCPASSLTGTGNVSNAICNFAGTKVPFVATINLDVQEIFQAIGGAHAPESGTGAGVQTGSKDYGFFQDSWIRFGFSADGDGGYKYGFHGNLIASQAQQGPGGNEADTSNSSFDREYFFISQPRYGQLQLGAGPTGATANFPYTLGPGGAGWGPPGPAINTVGPDGGIESQVLGNSPTTALIDGELNPMGADGMRDKGTMHIRYISPNFFGSDSDHGFTWDFTYSPDGKGHQEANFRTDSSGASPNGDIGGTVSPGAYYAKLMNAINTEFTYDEVFAKDFEFAAGVALFWAQSMGGNGAANTLGTFGGAPTGTVDGAHKANQDLAEVNSGMSLTYKENLTVGVDFTYAGTSLYPAETPAYNSTGTKTFAHNPQWGASIGVEYDWDRYQTGIYYQYATGQGDMNDVGYTQLQYLGFGGSVKVLKGLKVFTELMIFNDRNNHSNATITGGSCGSAFCKRESDGEIFVLGTSLDF
jgi:hypothetical protein